MMESKAQIRQKIILSACLQTQSPLRIASGLDDGITDILVLKNKQGKAFIPGTSLAGVLRNTLQDVYDSFAVEKMFGSVKENGNQSMLNISDIILENSDVIHRDGVKINTYTGVGEKGAKYDYESIDRGASGELLIEITIRSNDLEDGPRCGLKHNSLASCNVYADMAATIADLLTSGIKVGSLTTKGYGSLAAKNEVQCHMFDFTDIKAADAWVDYISNGCLPNSFYTGDAAFIAAGNTKDFIMHADFALYSSLIIRDYDSAFEREEKTLSSVQMMSKNDYVIPGTSIKGVVRNRCKKILDILMRDSDRAELFLNTLMGFAGNDKSMKSRLTVDEVYIKKEQLKSKIHSRNRIDRFTGGTIDGALFSEEPVWQTDEYPTIRIGIKISRCSEEEAGLMLLILKDLWIGKLTIGGGKSIGRGVLRGCKCRIQYNGKEFYINEDGNAADTLQRDILESYVEKLVVKCDGK